jgi:predicted metal-dependent hydrolase
MPPRKRRPERLDGPLVEPPLTPARARAFREGVACFDRGAWWEAHEHWEAAWRDLGDGPEDDAEIVLRGLIQLAAALHSRAAGRPLGARGSLANAVPKLARFRGAFWGVDLERVNAALHDAGGNPEALAALRLGDAPG